MQKQKHSKVKHFAAGAALALLVVAAVPAGSHSFADATGSTTQQEPANQGDQRSQGQQGQPGMQDQRFKMPMNQDGQQGQPGMQDQRFKRPMPQDGQQDQTGTQGQQGMKDQRFKMPMPQDGQQDQTGTQGQQGMKDQRFKMPMTQDGQQGDSTSFKRMFPFNPQTKDSGTTGNTTGDQTSKHPENDNSNFKMMFPFENQSNPSASPTQSFTLFDQNANGTFNLNTDMFNSQRIDQKGVKNLKSPFTLIQTDSFGSDFTDDDLKTLETNTRTIVAKAKIGNLSTLGVVFNFVEDLSSACDQLGLAADSGDTGTSVDQCTGRDTLLGLQTTIFNKITNSKSKVNNKTAIADKATLKKIKDAIQSMYKAIKAEAEAQAQESTDTSNQ